MTDLPTPEDLTGEMVKDLRTSLGLSAKEFNEECGFTQANAIVRIEKRNDFNSPGEKKVILRTVERLRGGKVDFNSITRSTTGNSSPEITVKKTAVGDWRENLPYKRNKEEVSGEERAARLDAALRKNGKSIRLVDEEKEGEEGQFVIPFPDSDDDDLILSSLDDEDELSFVVPETIQDYCHCTNRRDGFTNDVASDNWVHASCGKPSEFLSYSENSGSNQAGKAVSQMPDEETETGPDAVTREDAMAGQPIAVPFNETVERNDDNLKLISNSEITTWNRCKRKWWLQWYRELSPKSYDYLSPLAIGNRVHRALAAYYVPDGMEATDPRDALERVIVEDWTRISENFYNKPQEQIDEIAQKYNDSVALERAMVEGYIEWLEESGEDANLKIISSETPLYADLEIDLGYNSKTREHDVVPFRAIALLDARVVRRSDGARMFMDHKTVANFTAPRKVLKLNTQMLHYHLLEFLNTEEGEERCDGALYNMLRKIKRTKAAKPPFFDRAEVRHNSYEIENYRTRLIGQASDIMRVTAALDAGGNPTSLVYPNPMESCDYSCPFVGICNMFDDGSRVDDAIQGIYTQKNPLQRYDGYLGEK